jgi:hypothetical protein
MKKNKQWQIITITHFWACLFVLTIGSFGGYIEAQNNSGLFEESDAKMRAKMVGVARNSVGISMGINLPDNEFASIYDDELGGYANNGFVFSVDGNYLLLRNIGLAASFSMYSNNINNNAYLKTSLQRLPNGSEGSLTATKWRNSLVAVGPCISLPEKKVVFDLRLLLGLVHTASPEFHFEGSYEGNSIVEIRNKVTTVSPVFVFGGMLAYPLSTANLYNWSIFTKAEIIAASPNIKVGYTVQSDNYSVTSIHQYEQIVGTFALAIGF